MIKVKKFLKIIRQKMIAYIKKSKNYFKGEKIKEFLKKDNNKWFVIGGTIVLIITLIIISSVCYSIEKKKSEITYKETVVYQGDLTVGITESSTVDIGTVEQVFDLDISSLVSSDSSTSDTTTTVSNQTTGGTGGNIPGGSTDMFSQMFALANGDTNTATTTSENSMVVESVLVSVGERIEEGDPLLTLTSESVEAIRSQLSEDVGTAEIDLNELKTEQVSTRLAAKQTYDSNIAYGKYATTEYNLTLKKLNDAVDNAQDSYDLAQEELALLNEELEVAQTDYADAILALDAATYNVNSVDKYNNTYWYVQYENIRDEAESTLEKFESDVEKKQENVDNAETNLILQKNMLQKANREVDSGLLTAKETYALRLLAYNNAVEAHDVAIAYLEKNLESVESTYQDVVDKIDELDNYIVNQNILSEYSGVITEVALSEGDELSVDSAIISLYDDAAVTMTATVSEDDIEDIVVGNAANIVLTAYEDDIFQGEVSEISDATYNSTTGVNEYSVTVTMQGDVSGLYQGMTGDVTFITKEIKEVMYVSNRAIFRSGTDSYVKVIDESGDIVEKKITTGFSDGINAEILEGLSEGDVVLIESKVND